MTPLDPPTWRLDAGAASADPELLERVQLLLRAGGVALLPTDTIYGFSCRFDHEAAKERIRALKGPERSAPFLCLAADAAMVWRYAEQPATAGETLLRDHWPGPFTAILRLRESPGSTLAFRVPRHPFLNALLQRLDLPIVSTSANRTGEPPVESVEAARGIFGAGVDAYVDAGPLSGAPSTLVDLSGDEPRFLRGGPSR